MKTVFSPLQSGFIPGDSTTNQLTYLYDTFSPALDSGKEIRVVFRDISKALVSGINAFFLNFEQQV